MIDIENEMASQLTSVQINTIMSFALGEAENDGFVNSFVFERAMAVYTYLMLMEDGDEKDEFKSYMYENGVLETWDSLVKSGKAKAFVERCRDDLAWVSEVGTSMFDSYAAYMRSTRAALSTMELFSQDALENAAKSVQDAMTSDEYKNVMDIANRWGLHTGSR